MTFENSTICGCSSILLCSLHLHFAMVASHIPTMFTVHFRSCTRAHTDNTHFFRSPDSSCVTMRIKFQLPNPTPSVPFSHSRVFISSRVGRCTYTRITPPRHNDCSRGFQQSPPRLQILQTVEYKTVAAELLLYF